MEETFAVSQLNYQMNTHINEMDYMTICGISGSKYEKNSNWEEVNVGNSKDQI